MEKQYEVEFKVDAKILSIMYVCWRFKFPLAYFISFYEMYGAQTLFILKAMICTKRIALNDNALANLIEESKKLHHQILKGISTNIKIKQLERIVTSGGLIDEDIPERPELNLEEFSEEYKEFINNYLLKNVKNIFAENMVLCMDTKDLYLHA